MAGKAEEARALLANMGKKPSRILSGVTVVAIITQPYSCPHGKRIYCPGGSDFNTPQSYTGKEQALMRIQWVNYDPCEQVRVRLRQYEGIKPSKVDLIIMGGTFLAMPLGYQEWFITMALEAMNRYPEPKPKKFVYLEDAQHRNETARIDVLD